MIDEKKKSNLSYLFNEGPSNYVERIDTEGKVVSESPTAKRIYNPKTKIAEVSNAPIGVEAEVKTPEVEAPKTEAPPVAEAPKPMSNRVYASDAPSQQTVSSETTSHASPSQGPSSWERALIGATPLLVGLLTGNKLEGTQTSSKYFVGEESDRYKREKDLNDKLSAAQLKRKESSGKLQAKTFEYQGGDGVNRIGRFINGQQLIDEGNDPLSPSDATKDKFGQTVVESEKFPGRFEQWSTKNGKKYEYLGKDFKKEDVFLKDAFNPDTGKNEYKMFTKSGDNLGWAGQLPEGMKKYLTLEDRMTLKKFEKELKDPELKFKQTRDLNKDREGVITTKNTRELAEAHGKIMQSSFGKDPISDVSTVIALFKMMDPGSVVRESELALGLQARSYDDFVNNISPILTKQRYLTPAQVKGIRSLAEKMYQQQLAVQESSVDSQMKARAKEYGLNPESVAPKISSPYKPPTNAPMVRVSREGKMYNIPASQLDAVLKDDPSIKVEQ